ncbi:filaggrin-like [Mizuhopecten yessoensis]|uniref:Uncharacterized protein n=1 Tax=Mizuhopecten yessoensis TaxID=6573 RepID=A0A210R0M5_MIZYE|nr:filaggrin-like [Mizuhopecten yessoensis]OWF54431.1 hypothetical protein KP79_PYT08644 [Mizuhopecten yessoensis]
MAKKLLSLLKCPPTQNISVQVTDPDKIYTCIKQLHQSTDLMKDIYDAYSGTVKFGENKLRETDDTLTKMGVMLTNFDSSLNKWGSHLRTDAEQLREKEQRLERLKKEVEFDRNWLLEKREQFPMKLQDDDYQKAMRIQKIRDYREERGLLETRNKKADEQIEKILENIDGAEEKCDTIQKARGDQSRAHKADLKNLMVDWEESRGKRELLQSLDIHPKTLLSSLADKEDWRAKDKELSDLRKEHDLLRENVQDQQDRKDMLRLRNDELRRRVMHNEAVLHNLREEAKEEHLSKDGTSYKHEDRHESHRHGRSGASHRHHDKEGSSHRHGTSQRHHDHGTSHRHHSHGKPHKDHDYSTSHRYGSRDGSPPRHWNRDGSPPRHSHKDGTTHRHNRDGSPPRHRHKEGTTHRHDRDGSPPRHSHKDGTSHRHDRDGSPPRQSHKDGNSHRHDSTASHRQRSRDLSPQRHVSRDGSPPRPEKRDVSPPNKHANRDVSHGTRDVSYGHKEGSHGIRDGSHESRDVSPPRYGNRETSHRSSEGPHGNREGSPPRHQENFDTTIRRGSRVSASNTRNKDSSPQRHGNRDVSPPREGNRDVSQGNKERSPKRHENRTVSPGNRDESPVLRPDSHKDGTTHRRGSRLTSPKPGIRDGSSHTGMGRDTVYENRDGGYLQEQLSLSQFGSQTIVGHQSSDEDFTQL